MTENDAIVNCRSESHSENFTIVLNEAIRDKRLSWRARGILAGCLSHASSFIFSRAWIEENGTEGRAAVIAAMKELRELGYLRSVKVRSATGQITGERLVFTDRPGGAGAEILENRIQEKPAYSKPASSKLERIRRPIQEEHINPPLVPPLAKETKKLEIPESLECYRKEILEFWKNKKGKKTEQAWKLTIKGLLAIQEIYGDAPLRGQLEKAAAYCWQGITLENFERFNKTIAGTRIHNPINQNPTQSKDFEVWREKQRQALFG